MPSITPSYIILITPNHVITKSPSYIPSHAPTLCPNALSYTPSLLPTSHLSPSYLPSALSNPKPLKTSSAIPSILPHIVPSSIINLIPSAPPTQFPSITALPTQLVTLPSQLPSSTAHGVFACGKHNKSQNILILNVNMVFWFIFQISVFLRKDSHMFILLTVNLAIAVWKYYKF